MNQEIKCPFCESTEIRYRYHQYVEVRPYYVQCKGCLATGGSGNSQEQALERWAKRAEAPQEGACPFCADLDGVQMGAGDDQGDYMGCYTCLSFGPKKPTPQEAREAWDKATVNKEATE